ncbi:unnamed protein product [[Actinomadura] parvosata subsp. kistnae]|nr:unnamed protein product [Actinomadura parvosata subsp. kistnae]
MPVTLPPSQDVPHRPGRPSNSGRPMPAKHATTLRQARVDQFGKLADAPSIAACHFVATNG